MVPPRKPNFGLTGVLAQDAGAGAAVGGVTLKWSEPSDAAMPETRWRLYVYKDGVLTGSPLHLRGGTAFLIGRDRSIVDIATDHPSCSLQHAVIQFRLITVGSTIIAGAMASMYTVRPYIMDLESTNGTTLSGVHIDPARFYELRSGDVLKFGVSTREYVLLSEDAVAAGGAGGAAGRR